MRHVLLLDLKEDQELIARYEAHHAAGAVPAAIVRSIRASGIVAMEIYRSGNRLAMLMETDQSFDPLRKARQDRNDPDVVAWEALMDRFQQRIPSATEDEKWAPATRIFSLEEQI